MTDDDRRDEEARQTEEEGCDVRPSPHVPSEMVMPVMPTGGRWRPDEGVDDLMDEARYLEAEGWCSGGWE